MLLSTFTATAPKLSDHFQVDVSIIFLIITNFGITDCSSSHFISFQDNQYIFSLSTGSQAGRQAIRDRFADGVN